MTTSDQASDQASDQLNGERRPIRRALISVYDKAGLLDVARTLTEAGVELVSTGSTATRIADAGMPVTPVEQVTGFAECLDGRVKTLHPHVHAGLLADQHNPEHRAQLAGLGIAPFELVISNLYPFTQTVSSGAGPAECVEQIDIGGPSMVRAAAKNHASVAVITSPDQYVLLADAIVDGGFTLAQRQQLAAAAFVHTATYDVAVASWMGSVLTDSSAATGFPAWVGATWQKSSVLRYGENPHQRAALYRDGAANPGDGPGAGLAGAEQLHGKEMSYNNYVDGDAARRAAGDFDEPAVAIIKHANPCGIAVGADVAEAHRKAHACDPVSAFGGVVAANRPVSVAMATQLAEIFTEVVIAPGYEDGAVEVLSRKKNVRLLVTEPFRRGGIETRGIDGGMLMQSRDVADLDHDHAVHWTLVTGEPADRGDPGRPGVRLAQRPGGQVERDPAGQGRRQRRGRDGAGEPGGRLPARGGPGGRPVGRVGGGLGCLLPVRRRPGDPARGRRHRGGAARRFGAGRVVDRSGEEGGGQHVLHRRPALLPLMSDR